MDVRVVCEESVLVSQIASKSVCFPLIVLAVLAL